MCAITYYNWILMCACVFTKCNSVTSHCAGVSGVQRFIFIVININNCYIFSFSVLGKVNINFVLLTIFAIANWFYSCIFTINQSSVLACFYLQIFYLGVGFFQLAYVYCVIIISTFCYIMNLLTAHAYIAIAQYNTFIASTDSNTSAIYSCCTCCYAVYSQSLLQCQTSFSNLKVIFISLQLHRNCISVILINSNTLAFGIFSIGINRRKIYLYTILILTSYCQLFTI